MRTEKEPSQEELLPLYQLLHEFRNWNKDWDTFMAKKPESADDFVLYLYKRYKVEKIKV